MTAADFERRYAARSGVTVAELRALGRVVRPCACDARECEGWQSLSQDAAMERDYLAAGCRAVVLVSRGEVVMPFTRDQIAEMFTYHPPKDGQPAQYEAIRQGARAFAEILVANSPACPDQTVAIRKLRESVHAVNSAIANEGRF